MSSYFRTGKFRAKKLRETDSSVISFPEHFEVRFAEHLLTLIKAVLTNLPACREVWRQIAVTGSGKEKPVAEGYLRKWALDGRAVRVTAVMADICSIFCQLQKKFQRGDLVLPEVLEARDAALLQLQLMEEGPLPGGQEEKLSPALEDTATRTHNSLASSKRTFDVVRSEVHHAATSFLENRLDVEQEQVITDMVKMIEAKTAKDFISSARGMTSGLFGEDSVAQLTMDVCDQWYKMSEARDRQASMKDKLLAMAKSATGVCKRVLSAVLCVAPHSMATGRAVSHYNAIRSVHRLAMHTSTANDRLMISVNCPGTASFDPRPAVAAFLTKKDRRNRLPDPQKYTERPFVSKFFRADGSL